MWCKTMDMSDEDLADGEEDRALATLVDHGCRGQVELATRSEPSGRLVYPQAPLTMLNAVFVGTRPSQQTDAGILAALQVPMAES